CQQAYSYPQTF
nr:immunoglobulin light chain junction region [Macaca mulatta]